MRSLIITVALLCLLVFSSQSLGYMHCWLSTATLNFGNRDAANRMQEGSGEVVVECQNQSPAPRQLWLELSLNMPDDLLNKLSGEHGSLRVMLGFAENELGVVLKETPLSRRYKESLYLKPMQKLIRHIPVYGRLFQAKEQSGSFVGTIGITININEGTPGE